MTGGCVPGLAGRLILPAAAYARARGRWLAARRFGLGASETSGVLGVNPWKTPYSVWREKTSDRPPVEGGVGEAAEWGTDLEAVVARVFARRHPELGKLAPTPGLLVHEKHPHVLATLDRLLVPRRSRGGVPTSALEVKTVSEHMYRHHWLDGVPPVHILVQAQQQLAVTGLDHLWVAVLVGGQHMPEPYRVDRDDAVIETVIAYAGEWWQRHVVDGVRPPLTFADRDDLVLALPGDLDLDPKPADPPTLASFAEYVDARRRRDEAVDDMEVHGFAVKTYLGDHTALTDEHGTVLATWRPTKTGRSFRTKETTAA